MIVNITMNVIVIIMIVSITMNFTGSIVIVDPSPVAVSCDDHVHDHHHHHHLEQHGDEMHLEKQETTRFFRCLFPIRVLISLLSTHLLGPPTLQVMTREPCAPKLPVVPSEASGSFCARS